MRKKTWLMFISTSHDLLLLVALLLFSSLLTVLFTLTTVSGASRGMDRVAFVGYWHFSDIEAARSNVSLRALLGPLSARGARRVDRRVPHRRLHLVVRVVGVSVLHEQGYALHNLASLPHISIAGASATRWAEPAP